MRLVQPLLALWDNDLRIRENQTFFWNLHSAALISIFAISRIAILGTLLGVSLVQGSLHFPHAKVRISYVLLINLQRSICSYMRGSEWILRFPYKSYIVQIAKVRRSHVLLRTLHYAGQTAATYKPPAFPQDCRLGKCLSAGKSLSLKIRFHSKILISEFLL